MKYRLILTGMLTLALLGCSSDKGDAAKREADRQALRMEDLETQRNALRTKVQQLEKENAELKKQLAEKGK